MHEITLESENIKLQAQMWGSIDKFPILALHGWLDNSSSFIPLAKSLPQYHIIAPDLVGHGYSDHLPSNMLYSLDTHVLILLNMIDKLGWKKFSIMGHSLGAGIGAALASALPDQVTHLILLDTLGPPTLDEKVFIEQFMLNMQSRNVPEQTRNVLYKTKQEATEVRQLISSYSATAAQLIAERDLYPVDSGYLSRCDRRLQYKSHCSLTESQCLKLLAAVQCPSLLIQAENGILKDRDVMERKNSFKNLEAVNLAGQHHLHMDQPQLIVPYILEFLSR